MKVFAKYGIKIDVCANEQTFLIMREISYCFNYSVSDYTEASPDPPPLLGCLSSLL